MSPFERQLFMQSGSLIPMSQAAKLTPYSADYLSLLARKGRLRAVKISRDWLTTQEEILQYLNTQKIKHQNRVLEIQDLERRLV
jgi:hypothetical protein